MKINKAWHEKHRMPANANVTQRIEWHLQHALHCACRPVPAKLVAEMKKRKIKIPTRS